MLLVGKTARDDAKTTLVEAHTAPLQEFVKTTRECSAGQMLPGDAALAARPQITDLLGRRLDDLL